MLIFEVVGFQLDGKLNEGIIVIDLVLIVVEMLCVYGVVGKFVEFYGVGLDYLLLVDCVIIVNMVSEYGVICGFFLVDQEIIVYLILFGCFFELVELVEVYSKVQGLWWDEFDVIYYSSLLYLDMLLVVFSLVGFKWFQDWVFLFKLFVVIIDVLNLFGCIEFQEIVVLGVDYCLVDGDVVIVVIILCINIFNFVVMMVVGLIVQKVVELGIIIKFWVKMLLVFGFKVVIDYLVKVGL